MIDRLSARGLASLGQSFGLVPAAAPAVADDAALAIREQLQQWASINLEIAEAVGAAAHAEAENHTLAAELEEIAREVALIRAGLTVDAA